MHIDTDGHSAVENKWYYHQPGTKGKKLWEFISQMMQKSVSLYLFMKFLLISEFIKIIWYTLHF